MRCDVLTAEGGSALERLASLIAVPDFASLYLALAHGLDPMAVPAISEMKELSNPMPEGHPVSAEGGTKAIIAALAANLGIAVTKFIAWLLTGSSSMLAEAIHSVADSGNQVLLLIGGKRAAEAGHPGTPLRVRPGALHLRVHRVDRAVQRRRPVRAVRGLPQDPAPGGRSTSGSGCRWWCW